jgi:Arc/MetJ family transcription regulator
MRTTLNLDDAKIEEAKTLTGLTGKTAVIHAALDALIAQAAAQRLIALGGTDPSAWAPRRPRRGTRRRRR